MSKSWLMGKGCGQWQLTDVRDLDLDQTLQRSFVVALRVGTPASAAYCSQPEASLVLLVLLDLCRACCYVFLRNVEIRN